MLRFYLIALLGALVVFPVGVTILSANPSSSPCLSIGRIHYKLVRGEEADIRVKVTSDARPADFRIQFVDSPDSADFVLVDEVEAGACNQSARSIGAIGGDRAHFTVLISDTDTAYKIYVRSASFSREQAAAAFAVVWSNSQQQLVAQR